MGVVTANAFNLSENRGTGLWEWNQWRNKLDWGNCLFSTGQCSLLKSHHTSHIPACCFTSSFPSPCLYWRSGRRLLLCLSVDMGERNDGTGREKSRDWKKQKQPDEMEVGYPLLCTSWAVQGGTVWAWVQRSYYNCGATRSCTQGWGGGWPTCLVCIEKICLSLPSQKAQGLRDSLLMPQHPTRQGAEKHWEVEGRCSICLLSPISEWQSPGDLKVTSQKRAMFTKQSQWQRCQRPHHFTFLLRMLSILAPCPRDRKIPLGHWFAMNTTARHQGHRSP